MNAVNRQRRANARRIAQAAAAATAAAAAVALSGGAAHASAPTDLRGGRAGETSKAGTVQGSERRQQAAVTRVAATALPSNAAGLPVLAHDRADAVSGVPTVIDLYAGSLPTERALVAPTTAAAHGRAVINEDGTATYTSFPGFTGSDSFGYRYTDEQGRSSRVTVAVQVSPDNGPAALAYAA